MNRSVQVGKRLLQAVPVLIGVSLITFLLMSATPGDPIRLLLGDRATPETIAAVRERYGLDQPLLVQYLHYVKNLFLGDLGQSLRYRVPVTELIANHLPVTLFLVLYSVLIVIPPTVLLAVWAARREGQLADQVIRVFAVAGISIPVFWLGVMLARFFGITLGWFPVSGFGKTFGEHVHHLFLPALSTAIWVTPILMRNLRTTLIEQMQRDFVTASRSKGMPEGYIFRRHVFRNAILPTLHLFGIIIAYLFGGSVIVETVYAVPGMGALMVESILARDYYVVQGATLVFALMSIIVLLLVDIASTFIDPRVTL